MIENIRNTFAKEKNDLELHNRHKINELINDMSRESQRPNRIY